MHGLFAHSLNMDSPFSSLSMLRSLNLVKNTKTRISKTKLVAHFEVLSEVNTPFD